MTSDPGIPPRPDQPGPTDVVQQQLRLLVQSINALGSAIRTSGGGSTGHSEESALGRVGELTAQVAALGGWDQQTPGARGTDSVGEYDIE